MSRIRSWQVIIGVTLLGALMVAVEYRREIRMAKRVAQVVGMNMAQSCASSMRAESAVGRQLPRDVAEFVQLVGPLDGRVEYVFSDGAAAVAVFWTGAAKDTATVLISTLTPTGVVSCVLSPLDRVRN